MANAHGAQSASAPVKRGKVQGGPATVRQSCHLALFRRRGAMEDWREGTSRDNRDALAMMGAQYAGTQPAMLHVRAADGTVTERPARPGEKDRNGAEAPLWVDWYVIPLRGERTLTDIARSCIQLGMRAYAGPYWDRTSRVGFASDSDPNAPKPAVPAELRAKRSSEQRRKADALDRALTPAALVGMFSTDELRAIGEASDEFPPDWDGTLKQWLALEKRWPLFPRVFNYVMGAQWDVEGAARALRLKRWCMGRDDVDRFHVAPPK